MKRNLYCVHDNLNGFGAPFIDVNDSTAKRNFAYAINNNQDMHFAPQDYDLYKIGVFDYLTANIEVILPPELVVKGVSVFNIENVIKAD